MSKAELAQLERTIQRKQAELDQLEDQIINGKQDKEANSEEMKRFNRLQKMLDKYRKFLFGELNNVNINPTGNLDDLTSKVLAKYNNAIARKEAELDKSIDEYNKTVRDIKDLRKKLASLQDSANEEKSKRDEAKRAKLQAIKDYKNQISEIKDKVLQSKLEFQKLKFPTMEFQALLKGVRQNLGKAQPNLKSFQDQIDDHWEKEDDLEKQCDDYIAKMENKINQLTDQIKQTKTDIEKAKAAQNKFNTEQTEAAKIRNEVAQIKQNQKQFFSKFNNEISARKLNWGMKIDNVDKTLFNLIGNQMQVSVSELSASNQKLLDKKDLIQPVRQVVASDIKPSVIPVPPAGIKKYIEMRNEATKLCSDKQEIKYFLYGLDRLIQIYKQKKKQRDDSKAKYEKDQVTFETNYQAQVTIARRGKVGF